MKQQTKQGRKRVKTILILTLAAAFTVYALFYNLRSNFNMGVLLLDCIPAALWIYGLFGTHIDAFCTHGVGRVLKWMLLAGVAVFALLLGFVAISGWTDKPNGDEKALIVLGAGLRGDQVSFLLRHRLDTAFEYYQEHPDILIVVTGGQGSDEKIPEGVAMQRYLEARGVPAAQIICEDKSTSTEENFLYGKKLLEQRGVEATEPIAVVTNAFHCYRAGCYARMAGFSDVDLLPAGINPSSILPCYFREVFAVLYYWVFRSSRAGWMAHLVGTLCRR